MAAGSTFKQVEQNTAQNRRTQVLQSHYFRVYKHDFGIYLLLLLGTLACLSAFRHWQRSLNLRCGWRMLAPDPVLNWMLKKYVAMTASIQPKMRSVPSFFYDDGFKARNLHGPLQCATATMRWVSSLSRHRPACGDEIRKLKWGNPEAIVTYRD